MVQILLQNSGGNSINSKEWKSQTSLEWLFGWIEKIDISIYQEWKSLIFLHTSKISNFKEWSFTLQRVKFQSFKSENFNLFIECSSVGLQSLSIEVCLNLINIKANHSKRIVLREHSMKKLKISL